MFNFIFYSIMSIAISMQGTTQTLPWVYGNNVPGAMDDVFIIDNKMLGNTQETIDMRQPTQFTFSYYLSNSLNNNLPEDNIVTIQSYGINSTTMDLIPLKATTFKLDSIGFEDSKVIDVYYSLYALTGLETWRPGYQAPLMIGFKVSVPLMMDEQPQDNFIAYSMSISFALNEDFTTSGYDIGYENGFNDGNTEGLANGYNNGYNDGFAKGTEETNTPSINWLKKLMLTLNDILAIELFPNFKLSYIIGIFIIFPVLSWIIHWFRG